MLKNLTKEVTKLLKGLRRSFMKQPKGFRMLFLAAIIVVVLHKTGIVNLSSLGLPGLSNHLEGFQGNGSKTFVYINMKGCGHCQKLNPIWDEFSSEKPDGIEIKKIESNEGGEDGIGQKSVEKYNVEGFPFLAMVDGEGNLIEEYNGDRSKESLHKFAEKHA